jgi:peptidoglycan/LPS O-acetylase OafA/YrhL
MDIVHWFIGQQWGTVLSGQHLSFYILLVSALTVLMAGLSYRFVEKPSIDLGRRLSSH